MAFSQNNETIEAPDKVDSPDKNIDLMASYLMNSNYYQHLRHSYPHFLHLQEQQKNALVRNSEIFRVKEDHSTMLVNFSQPTLCILVYGELQTGSKIYAKGSYLTVQPSKVEIHFLKKTAILMLNSQQVAELMNEFQQFYTQKDILEKTLPADILGLDKRRYKILCSQAQSFENTTGPPYSMAFQQQKGVYLLYEGTYSLVTQDQLKITHLVMDFYGQQCLWGQNPKYHLVPETYTHKYIWLSKKLLLQVLTPEALTKLKELHQKREQVRDEFEKKCRQNLALAKTYLRGKQPSSVHKKFTTDQIGEFQNILQEMSKKKYRPKWKHEEDRIRAEKIEKMKEKRIYMPKKAKPRYFSTLTDRHTSPDYHHIFHKVDSDPFYLKLHLQERAPTQVLSHRRSRTETTKATLESQQLLRRKTSYGYYSYNYDRSYSKGMINLSKMQRYDQMKQTITLKKGQKVMSASELTSSLSTSFAELYSTLKCKNRKHRMDHQQVMRQTMKKTHLLAKRIMQSRGATTWR